MRQQDFHQHSSTLHPSTRHSISSPFVHRTFCQLPSTFCLSVEYILCGSWTFCVTSDNFLCARGSFHQVFVRQQHLQSPFVNIPCSRGLPSACVNLLCGCGTYRQLSLQVRDHLPTFRASEGLSINFPYVWRRSINFHQLSVHPRDYLSNFCVSAEHCVIFSKHFVRPQGFPSTSVKFCTFSAPSGKISCDHGSICQILSTFHASADIKSTFLAPAQPSVNFHQLSVRLRDLP